MRFKPKHRFENRFVQNLAPYKVSSHEAWSLGGDKDVLKLDWNESTQSPSPKVMDALKAALKNDRLNWYPDIDNQKLTNALSRYAGVPAECVQYFASSDDLHEYAIRAFCDALDRITIVGPTYDNFRAIAESMGAEIQFFYLDQEFRFDMQAFEKHLEEHNPKLVYLCNPNNPTGTEYDPDLLIEILARHPQRFFILDEAYYEFAGRTAAPHVQAYPNFLVTRTFSKAFGLASFRVGYTLSHPDNIRVLNKVRNPKSIATLSQVAAMAALEDVPYMLRYVTEVRFAKQEFTRDLKALGYEAYASGGNFVLIQADKEHKAKLIRHLQANKIFVRDYGHVPRMENYFRITIGTREQMKRTLSHIKELARNKKSA